MKKVLTGLSLLLVSLLVLTALVFYFPSKARAADWETKTVEVEADTYANKAYPDQPRGSVGSVIISNTPINRFGYFKFPLADLPDGAVIDKVMFKFYVHEHNNSNEVKLNLGPIKDDWDGNTLTWNNKPSIYQTKAIEARISLDFGWKEIDITDIYNFWLEENKGLFVYPYGYLYGVKESDFYFSLRAKEAPNFGQSADFSRLVVSYHLVPSPSPSASVSPSPSPSPSLLPSPSPEASATLSPDGQTSPSPLAVSETTVSASPKEEKSSLAKIAPFLLGGGGAVAVALGLGGIFWLKKKKKRRINSASPKKSAE